jgi:hypothetical protein
MRADMATPAERLVTDLPIWTDCPFVVSQGVEVRRGTAVADGPDIVALWNPSAQRHVAFSVGFSSQSSFDAACEQLSAAIPHN